MNLEQDTATAVADPAPVSDAPIESDLSSDTGHDSSEADLDTALLEVYNKHNPARDEAGRFRSAKPVQEAAPAETEVSTDQPLVEEQKEAVTPAFQPPATWSAEEKTEWANLPPKAQEAILRREREAAQEINRKGQELKAYEPLKGVIEQNKDIFERNGVAPDDGIGRLLAAERMLSSNPVAAIGMIAQAYGVDLGQFAQGQQEAGNVPPQVAQLHQRIAWLESQLNETSTRIQQREQEESTAKLNSAQTLLENFSKDKPDWADLENDIEAELISLNAMISAGKVQPMSVEQKLQKAYDRALRNNPEVQQRRQEQERQKAEAKRVEEARKKAEDAKRARSVNVGSSPANGNVIRNLDDDLMEVWKRHNA